MDTVLRKFPKAEAATQTRLAADFSPALLDYLQRFKYSPGTYQKPRASRKRLLVEPGKSISADDLSSTSNSSGSPRPASPALSSASSDAAPTLAAGAAGTSANASRPRPNKPSTSAAVTSSDSDTDDSDAVSSEDEWQPPKKSRNVFVDFR
ncbi:hypothetical protein RRG08_039932 [Elysia crispata]|uniref:Uncharacterized protein n=1 Tax=Elysia crispata TaxID=231223 RepID=A0AAE1BBA8_9GAST|nr:hypothetical protein RRG08_039932 [Elysia crispata]